MKRCKSSDVLESLGESCFLDFLDFYLCCHTFVEMKCKISFQVSGNQVQRSTRATEVSSEWNFFIDFPRFYIPLPSFLHFVSRGHFEGRSSGIKRNV